MTQQYLNKHPGRQAQTMRQIKTLPRLTGDWETECHQNLTPSPTRRTGQKMATYTTTTTISRMFPSSTVVHQQTLIKLPPLRKGLWAANLAVFGKRLRSRPKVIMNTSRCLVAPPGITMFRTIKPMSHLKSRKCLQGHHAQTR